MSSDRGRGAIFRMLLEEKESEKLDSDHSSIQTVSSEHIAFDESVIIRRAGGRGQMLNVSDDTNVRQTTFLSKTDSDLDQESSSGHGSSMEFKRSFGRGKVLETIDPEHVVLAIKAVQLETFDSDNSKNQTSQQITTDHSGVGSVFRGVGGRGRLLNISDETNLVQATFLGSSMELKPYVGRAKVLQMIGDETTVKFETAPAKPEQVAKKMEEEMDVIDTEPVPVICRGKTGRPVQIISNYIRLKTDPAKGVFEYEVRFAPEVHSMALRYKLLNQHRDTIGDTKRFDGAVLFLPTSLPHERTELVSTSEHDGATTNVTIIYKKKKLFKDCVQLYNILFDRIMKILKFVRFGRKTFDPSAPKLIPQHKVEIWPGYVTAVD